ncbi:MAG: hypothetical protein V4619_02790 [Bacteroidota bacterium]
MKTVLIYMLSLALLLVGGYHHANGATSGRHHISKFITNADKFQSAKSDRQSVVGTAATVDKSQTLVSVEDEEDDASFGRKLMPLAGYFVALVFAAFLLNTVTILQIRLPHAARLLYSSPQKYLLQGALLI